MSLATPESFDLDVESAVSEDARETGVRLQGRAPVSMVARVPGEDNLCYKDA